MLWVMSTEKYGGSFDADAGWLFALCTSFFAIQIGCFSLWFCSVQVRRSSSSCCDQSALYLHTVLDSYTPPSYSSRSLSLSGCSRAALFLYISPQAFDLYIPLKIIIIAHNSPTPGQRDVGTRSRISSPAAVCAAAGQQGFHRCPGGADCGGSQTGRLWVSRSMQVVAGAHDHAGSWQLCAYTAPMLDLHQHACVCPLLQCYKAVPVLMDKQLRKAQGAERMNIMYAVSKVLRLAKKELKGKSKYGKCLFMLHSWG